MCPYRSIFAPCRQWFVSLIPGGEPSPASFRRLIPSCRIPSISLTPISHRSGVVKYATRPRPTSHRKRRAMRQLCGSPRDHDAATTTTRNASSVNQAERGSLCEPKWLTSPTSPHLPPAIRTRKSNAPRVNQAQQGSLYVDSAASFLPQTSKLDEALNHPGQGRCSTY